MKLQILQENLENAVSIASRFASAKAQLPILGNILLTAQKTKIYVCSTNLELSVSVNVGAKVEKEGEISVPARVLNEIVSNLPRETVTLDAEKEQLKISTPGFSSNILGLSSSDFPKIPNTIDRDKSLFLPQKEFTEAINQVVFATSVDETRPILTGVLFILAEGHLTLVATDGFRLSQKKLSLGKQKNTQNAHKVVIPKAVLNELGRSGEGGDELFFNLEQKEKQAIFGLENVVLTSRLLEGEYPDFEKILPKSAQLSILTDKEEFLRAVKLASVFARDAANVVKIKVLKDKIKVSAESGQSGSQEASVDMKTEGSRLAEGFEISFNYRFLEDFLHSARGEEIKMEFSSQTAPGVFLDTSDSSYLHLIMPVRVQG